MSAEKILDSFRYYTGEHNHARYNEINQAYRDVLKRTKLWNQHVSKTDLLELETGVNQYLVDFSCFRTDSPDEVFIKNSSSAQWDKIEELSSDNFEKNLTSGNDGVVNSSSYKTPTCFRLSGDSTYNFSVSPIPDKGYNIRFDGVRKIEELSRGVKLLIPENYHDSIALLAASLFLAQKSDAMQQDLNKSAALKIQAEKELATLYKDFNKNRLRDLNWTPRKMVY